MPPVTIYTTPWCPYCQRARALLDSKGVTYENIDVDGSQELRRAMSGRAAGRTSVPQIFIGERHVGGCDDLHALEARGELDRLLAAGA